MDKQNKVETDSWIQRTNRWLPDGADEGVGKKMKENRRYRLWVIR